MKGSGRSLRVLTWRLSNTLDASLCLGAVGTVVIQGSRMQGAARIFGIDTNPNKFELSRSLGAHDCIKSADFSQPIQDVIV